MSNNNQQLFTQIEIIIEIILLSDYYCGKKQHSTRIVIIKLIGTIITLLLSIVVISNLISGDYFCRVGHGTCNAAKSARYLIESNEKARVSRALVFSTKVNLNHPAASWQATQTCSANVFKLLEKNNALHLFESNNKIELRMGYDSFFSIETIDKIHEENIKEIQFKNETMYVSLPNPTLLITTTSTPEKQISISVMDDDNKENLPTDTAPCLSFEIPQNYTEAMRLLNMN